MSYINHPSGTDSFPDLHVSSCREPLVSLLVFSYNKHFLFKMFSESGGSFVTRGCAVDSGSATADTELVRISHCGAFYLDNK